MVLELTDSYNYLLVPVSHTYAFLQLIRVLEYGKSKHDNPLYG